MSNLHIGKGSIRKSFGGVKDIVAVPNLIEIQSASFNDFVQLDYLPSERRVVGLEKVLKDIFPIVYNDKISLEYVSYELGNWACACKNIAGIENRYRWTCSSCKKSDCSRLDKNLTCTFCKKTSAKYQTCSNCLSRVGVKLGQSLEESKVSGQTFMMPLRIKIQLVNWDEDESGNKIIRDIKEQDIFFMDLPVMADLYEEDGRYELGSLGTFLINGVDRVVVTQLHRSPGAIFSQSKKVKDFRGRPYYLARIIPMRGSWLDFEFDSSDNLYVRIDKKKKVLITVFLQSLGIARDDIINLFYNFDVFYEKRFLDGQEIKPGKILIARYQNQTKNYYAIYFKDWDEHEDYYNLDGKNLRRQFLKSPLNYKYISSGFTYKRMHPILGRYTPHLGIDYAAATGTPVSASGAGTVISAGWKYGIGKTVIIRHNEVYTTRYSHLNSYARGIKYGAKVSQGQVIGYVGNTGEWSAGAHLEYAMSKYGTPINPLNQNFERSEPVKEMYQADFNSYQKELIRLLEEK